MVIHYIIIHTFKNPHIAEIFHLKMGIIIILTNSIVLRIKWGNNITLVKWLKIGEVGIDFL